MRVATDQRESADDRNLPPEQPARLGGTDLFRGAMVILAAVVIGGLVLSRGIDDDADGSPAETEQADADPTAGVTTDSAVTTDTTVTDTDPLTGAAAGTDASADPNAPATDAGDGSMSTETTDTTATPLDTVRSPAEVRTLVLNAGGPQGIAGRATELLQAASYTTAAAKNADLNGPSVVYYVEGYEDEAVAVVSVFGPGLDGLVQPLDPANPPSDDIQDAAVIVVVGNDDIIAVP